MEKQISLEEAWRNRKDREELIRLRSTKQEEVILLNQIDEEFECYFQSFGITYVKGHEAREQIWTRAQSAERHLN